MKYKMIHVQTSKGEFVFSSVKEVAQFFNISTSTVYFYMKKQKYKDWKITPYYFESGKKVLSNYVLAWYKK